MEYRGILFVDTTCVAPCPIEPLVSYDFAKHFKLLVSGRSLEVVHHDFDDFFVQRFIALPCVRERGITVEFPNLLVDESMIDVGSRGSDERCKGWG